jgi:hypothetical protein
MSYNAKVHSNGPDQLVIESGASINIATGGKILAAGTQAAHIADEAAITGGQDPTEAEFNALLVKFNALLAACRGAGILATS